ncbi:MFS transporter [Methylocella sp.]|uniref:MFS transporter n=1 Tax=Methylocella sp. TaxID=1978226 RepID=UPI0035AE6ECB
MRDFVWRAADVAPLKQAGLRARRMKAALFVALVAHVSAQAFLLAALPALGRRLGFADVETGAILSGSALLLIVGAPFWGYLSERIGRRPVILLALAGAAAGPLAFSVVVSARLADALTAAGALALFLSARMLQALFVGGLAPSAQAYMADVTAPRERMGGMGLIGAAFGLGAIGGASLAWRVGSHDPALAFRLAAAFVAVGFVLVLLFAPEPHLRRAARPALRPLLARIWPFVAITLLAFAAYGVAQQAMALQLQDAFGFTIEQSIEKAGVLLMAIASAMVLVQGVIFRARPRRPERLLLAGAIVGALAMGLCVLARSFHEILATLILFGVALGLTIPANLAALSLRAGAPAQGAAAGLNMMGQGLGLAIGPLAGAALHRASPLAPFTAAAALLACAAALAALAMRGGARETG